MFKLWVTEWPQSGLLSSWLVLLEASDEVVSIVSPLNFSENSPKYLSGRLVSLFQPAISVGIVVAMLVNAGIVQLSPNITDSSMAVIQSPFRTDSWHGRFMMGAIPALLFLVLCFAIPHSPRWLVGKGQIHKAQQVL